MTDLHKSKPFKTLLGVAIVLLFTLHASPIIYYNWSNLPFDAKPGEAMSPESVNLNTYIVQGASFSLEAYSHFLTFSHKAEIAELEGINYEALQQSLNDAITDLESAKNIYILLKQEADVTPYNPLVIDMLLTFNYEVFWRQYELNEPIFRKVKAFLGKGQIRELFDDLILQTEVILDKAYTLKTTVDAYQFPVVENLWDLNHRCSESLLFGQYVARIFKHIQ